jgi:hypothetical protein
MRFFLSIGLFVSVTLGGCGLYTPAKDPLLSESIEPDRTTLQGDYETGLIAHITCEIGQGLLEAHNNFDLKWLDDWGTTITQSSTAEDQGGLSPGLTAINPLHNVVFPFSTGGNVISPQSFSFSVGGSASANALRTETIQYTFKNSVIRRLESGDCSYLQNGIMIDGDLKIRQFIYDKAVIANSSNASALTNGNDTKTRPPFNTFTEEITFVAAYGATATPTWHLARISANTAANLATTERTITNDLVITLGPLNPKEPKLDEPLRLSDAAMSQHLTRVQASAIAVSVTGQTH